MEKIREIVRQNLIILRKQHNLTQSVLASEINFSDKAISRWENGESLPDYETIEALANFYEVDVAYFFTEHPSDEVLKYVKLKEKRKATAAILFLTAVWSLITIIFVWFAIFNNKIMWQLFIWGIPFTALFLYYFNRKVVHNKYIFIVSLSIFCWGILSGLYCQFIHENIWPVFLVGIPTQAAIILLSFIYYRDEDKKE